MQQVSNARLGTGHSLRQRCHVVTRRPAGAVPPRRRIAPDRVSWRRRAAYAPRAAMVEAQARLQYRMLVAAALHRARTRNWQVNY